MNNEDLIKDVYDEERGCGFREEGGLYFRTDAFSIRPCGRVPLEIEECECCGLMLKQSRGFQWFHPQKIIASVIGQHIIIELIDDKVVLDRCDMASCGSCPFGAMTPMKAGLIWIGAEHYATHREFMSEAVTLGISRRIPAVPKGFKLGEHWIYLAHPHVFGKDKAGIFTAFKPTAIEYVVKGDEDDDELKKMIANGITPVRVHSEKHGDWIDQPDMSGDDDEPDIDDDFPMSLEYDDDKFEHTYIDDNDF